MPHLLLILTSTKAAFVNLPLAVKRGEGNSGVAVDMVISSRIIVFAVLASTSDINPMVEPFVITIHPFHLFSSGS